MNNRVATVLSVVFHPLIITTYLLGSLFVLTPDLVGVSALELNAIGSLTLLIFLNTFVVPSIIIYYLYRFGFISSMHVDQLSERRLPYIVSIITYAIATYLFGWQLQPIGELAPQISILLASVTFSLVVVAVISLFWKISAHATGLGGVIGVLFSLLVRYDERLLLPLLLMSIFMTGFVLSARLQLNAHSPLQITIGLLFGLLISMGMVYQFF